MTQSLVLRILDSRFEVAVGQVRRILSNYFMTKKYVIPWVMGGGL